MAETETDGRTKARIWLDGRCDRREYWAWVAPMILGGAVATFVGQWAALAIIPITFGVYLFAIRRFHDLGWSGFAIVPMFILMFGASYLFPAAFGPRIGSILSLAFANTLRVVLGLWPGQAHANRFGLPPRSKLPIEVFS